MTIGREQFSTAGLPVFDEQGARCSGWRRMVPVRSSAPIHPITTRLCLPLAMGRQATKLVSSNLSKGTLAGMASKRLKRASSRARGSWMVRGFWLPSWKALHAWATIRFPPDLAGESSTHTCHQLRDGDLPPPPPPQSTVYVLEPAWWTLQTLRRSHWGLRRNGAVHESPRIGFNSSGARRMATNIGIMRAVLW